MATPLHNNTQRLGVVAPGWPLVDEHGHTLQHASRDVAAES